MGGNEKSFVFGPLVNVSQYLYSLYRKNVHVKKDSQIFYAYFRFYIETPNMPNILLG